MSRAKAIAACTIAGVAVIALSASKLLSSKSEEAAQETTQESSQATNQNYIIEPKITGKVVITHDDSVVFHKYAEKAQMEGWSELTPSEIIKKTGEFLKGTPYEALTLEGTKDEQLVVNLRGLDCLTFVETTLALTSCVKDDEMSIEGYENELCRVRYRHGVMDGYASRLHYLSDWMRDSEEKGLTKDITKSIKGCEKIKMTVNYMSSHPDRYAKLKDGGMDLERIKAIEKDLTESEHWYIPKSKINEETYKSMESGDIICWVTDAEGLDYGHVGFALKDENGTVHFMHASISIGKVLIDPRPLARYASNKPHFTGMSVLRVK